MKNLFSKIALSALAVFFFGQLSAQSFEGEIHYTISWENLPEEMASMEAMLPKEATGTVKGHMYKFEQPQPMGGKQITIMDNEAESGVLLMDMMGQKKAVVLDKEQRDKMNPNPEDPEFQYMDETKEIAGYDCKKALMTMNSGEQEVTLEIFYTDEIDNVGLNQFEGLKGFPLQYSTSMGNFIMTLTADKVEEKKVSEEAFAVPDGYEHISLEELQKSMGGGAR